MKKRKEGEEEEREKKTKPIKEEEGIDDEKYGMI